MKGKVLKQEIIVRFKKYLAEEEKSNATIKKYIRDVTAFASYADGAAICKEKVVAYKQHLLDENYAVRSINSMLAI